MNNNQPNRILKLGPPGNAGFSLATGIFPFMTAGNWAVALIALFVMDFLLLQIFGLIRLQTSVAVS